MARRPGENDEPSTGPFDHLPPDRRRAIESWLSTPLADCRICGEPVLPTSSRGIDGNDRSIGHFACLEVPLGDCGDCGKTITSFDQREEYRKRLMHKPCADRIREKEEEERRKRQRRSGRV